MALVGEASSGKSTVLTAIWTLLEAAAPPPTIEDVSRGTSGGRIHLEAELERGRTIFLDATTARHAQPQPRRRAAGAVPPGESPLADARRAGDGRRRGRRRRAASRRRSPAHHWAAADGGLALVRGMERLLASNLRRFVLLIEEPELYLSPHSQRHLFRVLRRLAEHGNQILYSTHAPVFLSVDRMEELALVRHTRRHGTTLFQPEPLAEAESFRALSEFDSDRAELFLARAALLVEGRTEKMTFPLVFDALGIEAGQGGRPRAGVRRQGQHAALRAHLQACGIPYVVVHDRDAPEGQRPVESERVMNQQIQEVAGRRRTVVLAPDFEAVSGVTARGRGRKPRKAYRRYFTNGDVPAALRTAVEKVLRAARS